MYFNQRIFFIQYYNHPPFNNFIILSLAMINFYIQKSKFFVFSIWLFTKPFLIINIKALYYHYLIFKKNL
jgi:hypothetical protein